MSKVTEEELARVICEAVCKVQGVENCGIDETDTAAARAVLKSFAVSAIAPWRDEGGK
jgi:hypothetical protein